MPEADYGSADVERFILERIESVPHLEALLLLWREQPKPWSADGLTERLWVRLEAAKSILQDLARDDLITAVPDSEEYSYSSNPQKDRLLTALSEMYRRDLIRISKMIHLKATSPVRGFAQAFRLKKEQE